MEPLPAQIFLMKDNNHRSLVEGTLLAVGGRYDYLLHQMWDREYIGYAPVSSFAYLPFFKT